MLKILFVQKLTKSDVLLASTQLWICLLPHDEAHQAVAVLLDYDRRQTELGVC